MKASGGSLPIGSELVQLRQGLDAALRMLQRLSQADIHDLSELLLEIKAADEARDHERLTAAIKAVGEVVSPQHGAGGLVAVGASRRNGKPVGEWSTHVAKTVRRIRGEKKLTQIDLAKASGLTQSHVSRIENGTLSPSRKTVERIAKALGVTVSKIDPSAD